MAFMDHLVGLLPDTITVTPGANDWEGAFTASGSTFAPRCRIEGDIRNVRDLDGKNVVSTIQIYLDDAYSLNTYDYRFTLPARYPQRTLVQAVAVAPESDEVGPQYEIVYLP
jgi:hypothetical protein